MAMTSISRSALRRGLAGALAMSVVTAPPVVLTIVGTAHAAAAVDVEPSPDVELEVQVAPGIAEAADLHRWIAEEARETLADLPAEPGRRGSVRVAIDGTLYEYQVTITSLRDGEVVAAPARWACECSNEELLARLRGELPKAAAMLEVAKERAVVKATPEPEPVSSGENDRTRERKRGRLGPAGSAGVTLMTLGATGLGTGAAFLILGVEDLPRKEEYFQSRDFSTPGQVIAVGGGGLLLTGALLYLLRKRVNPERRQTLGVLTPSLDIQGRAHITVTGRF